MSQQLFQPHRKTWVFPDTDPPQTFAIEQDEDGLVDVYFCDNCVDAYHYPYSANERATLMAFGFAVDPIPEPPPIDEDCGELVEDRSWQPIETLERNDRTVWVFDGLDVYRTDDKTARRIPNVTHWMPYYIPEPPKETP